MSSNRSLNLDAFALGAMAGMRTWSPVAFVSHHISHSQESNRPAERQPFSLMGSRTFSRGAILMAATELVADKLPILPNRIDPIPLAGRAASGAFVGATWVRHRGGNGAAGACIGALAAVAATFAGFYYRRAASRQLKLPDPIAAVIEDMVVIAIGLHIVDRTDP